MTKIICLFGGPGSGKSTTAAGLFHKLKINHINCELVTEFAKLLTWSKRFGELTCQPYVFGKQLKNMQVLIGEVDVIVTDSPIILSCIYGENWPKSFNTAVVDIFNSFDNINYFINRKKIYNPKGRSQTEAESIIIDQKIHDLLIMNNIPYKVVDGDESAVDLIYNDYTKVVDAFRPHPTTPPTLSDYLGD